MCDFPSLHMTSQTETNKSSDSSNIKSKQITITGTDDGTTDFTSGYAESVDIAANNQENEVSSGQKQEKDVGLLKSRSSKRRSGFSRGRISLTQLSKDTPGNGNDISASELYRQVPVDLPPARRLSFLTRLALRHTLDVLDSEFENVPGFENFRSEAVKGFEVSIDQMETDGTFEQICCTPNLLPNPVNLQWNTTISELKNTINRLHQEMDDWNELVSNLEALAKQAEQQLTQLEMTYDVIPKDVKEMAQNFLPPVDEGSSLAVMSVEAVKNVKAISLLIDDYCHSVELLNCASRAAEKHMSFITNSLEQESGSKNEDPKECIQKLLAS